MVNVLRKKDISNYRRVELDHYGRMGMPTLGKLVAGLVLVVVFPIVDIV